MTNMTLQNSGGTATLDFVTGYRIGQSTEVPVKRIPAKTKPTVETSLFTALPRLHTIRARVKPAVKTTLEAIRDSQTLATFNDGGGAVQGWVTDMRFAWVPYKDYKWVVDIEFTRSVY